MSMGFLALGVSVHATGLLSSSPQSLQRRCSLSDAWPSGPGAAFRAQDPPGELRNILRQINVANINATITKLVSFGTRSTLSSQTDPLRGIGAARDWLNAQMQGIAAKARHGTQVSVEVQTYEQAPASGIPFAVNISNVLATITGAEEPNRVYIITGHYDSRNSDVENFEDDAPGANDDASGVAVALEILRILSRLPPPKATIILGAVSGEEQGLFGSTFFAKQMKAAGKDIQGMFTNDIVGSPTSDRGVIDAHSIRLFAQGIPSIATLSQAQARLSVGGENDSPARELARFVDSVASNSATDMTVRIIYRVDRFLRGGDHRPFLEQGFPAARFTEPNENFAHQHQNVRVDSGVQFGDLIEFVNMDFTARVARVNAAALWSLAQAPGTPKGVRLDTSVLTNNSTLSWTLDTSTSVASYEILWRGTTDDAWHSVVPVGLVNKATIQLSKDNAVFGVRAVGTNGYRSPAAFPCAGC